MCFFSNEIFVEMRDIINKITIKQYIDLLAEMNLKLVNIKNNQIPIQDRKSKAYHLLITEIAKLDGAGLETCQKKLETKINENRPKKVTNNLLAHVDSNSFKIGEIVVYFTKYRVGDTDYKIYVKCKVKKINKCSVVLTKYSCDIDFTDVKKAIQEQTIGKLKFIWTDTLRDNDVVLVKKTTDIIRRGSSENYLYENYINETHYRIDFNV